MKKLLLSLIMVIIVCVALTGCGDYDKDYVYDGVSLVGKWQEADLDEGNYKVYEFYADGTVTYASCIYGMVPDGYVTAKYKVEGNNTLVLTERLNGKIMVSRMKFSISEDNVLVLVDEKTEDEINKLEPYKLGYDEPSPIKGKWLSTTDDRTDLFWFGDDSECLVFPDARGEIGDNVDEFIKNGEYAYIMTVLYSTEGSTVNLCFADQYIVSEDSVITGEYKIENNKLIISNDGKVVYEFVRCE